ncbi:MAG: peptide ABC transporter substrate-binding protein [Actinobacteria bacterium 13_1_20CM_3_71_11]|nr:MAG: peptide ABC transporter substrate-binding protein [Actinobacteria bacterium 13_1_20CM_3_71_11]
MKRRTGVAVASVAALALVLAGCAKGSTPGTSGSTGGKSGFNAATEGVVNPSDKKGGTLKFASSSDIDSWDPARAYYAWAWNMQRFYIRTLVAPQAKPGKEGLKLVNDLAQSQDISSDGLTYTYKLKSGLKYEDGSTIKSEDIKYGIERVFAQDVLSGGPTYLSDQLDQGQNYPGPYKDTDPKKLGLKSVETPDDNTIVFHLKSAFADFPYLLAMGGAAPVPAAKDKGDKYADHPISSGPYMFKSIEPGKKVVLVRNSNWDQSTDPIRKALPDEIDLTLGMDPNEIDSELLDGTLDIDTGQTGVQAAAQAKILTNPDYKKNADEPTTGFIRYIAISTKVPPFDNIHCRLAVQYATDKVSLQTVRGGPDAGGAIGTSMLPPNINGYDANLAPFTGKTGQPDLAKAKDELAKCGKPNGFTTVIAARNKGKEPKVAEALQQSLAKVGINATIDQSDPSLYFRSTIGSPDNVHKKGYGLMNAGWGADFPTGYGFLDVLVDGDKILPSGNNNYEELNDPAIQSLIKQATAATDPDKAAKLWGQINAKVMDTASLLPYVYDKALNYRNPRLTNVYIDGYFGMDDFSALGVS